MKEGEGEKMNQEECPICKGTLGNSWAILVCGHSFCCDCQQIINNRSPGENVSCPICREKSQKANVSYVSTLPSPQETESGVRVAGSHSSKVSAILRTLLSLRQKDPTTKTLVFSQWNEVLEIVSRAMDENKIPHLFLRNNTERNIAKFRSSDHFNVLLLGLASGANGLNLTEATHVVLCEPTLNRAAEQQAVGRVHRIGQEKETTVHRFLVRGSVEDRLNGALPPSAPSTALLAPDPLRDSAPFTLSQLAQLFH